MFFENTLCALRARAMALPVEWRLVGLLGHGILFAVAWLATASAHAIAWALAEMARRAAAGTKRAVAPLLWPAAIVLGGGLLAATAGPDTAAPILGIGALLWWFTPRKKSEKKKKKGGH